MKITVIAGATIIAATSAHADTYWYCKGDECVGRSVRPSNPLGTYDNPIQDELEGDLSVPSSRDVLYGWRMAPRMAAAMGAQPGN